MPGPLFTFSAFLGAISNHAPAGWLGAAIALVAIFLPAFLLISGILPFWEALRRMVSIRRAMSGINASVLGILVAAFYNPVCTTGLANLPDCALASASFLLLLKLPAWLVVILTTSFAGITHL